MSGKIIASPASPARPWGWPIGSGRGSLGESPLDLVVNLYMATKRPAVEARPAHPFEFVVVRLSVHPQFLPWTPIRITPNPLPQDDLPGSAARALNAPHPLYSLPSFRQHPVHQARTWQSSRSHHPCPFQWRQVSQRNPVRMAVMGSSSSSSPRESCCSLAAPATRSCGGRSPGGAASRTSTVRASCAASTPP